MCDTSEMVETRDAQKQNLQVLNWLPLVCGAIAVILVLNTAFQAAMAKTNNTLVYALDDAYIHLSIAKNIAHNGVWGINGTTPSSATSSPLWTSLLAILNWLPVDPILLPLVLNIVFALGCVFAVFSLSRKAIPNPWLRGLAAAIITFALPLVSLVFLGMEHLLHCLFAIVFVAMLIYHPRTGVSRKRWACMLLFGMLMMLTRYESVFLFFVPAAVGVYRRQSILVAPLLGAVAGVFLFGLLSMRVGMPFIPGTLLLKTDVTNAGGFFPAMIHRLTLNVTPFARFPTVVPVGLAGVAAVLLTLFASPRVRLAGATVLLAVALHVTFSYTQYLYRYEAYLAASMALVVLIGLPQVKGALGIAARLAAAVFGVALMARGVVSFRRTPIAMQNIHDQQYQMSLFLSEHYAGKTVALNDIGAASFYTNCNIIDLFGLANEGIAERKRAGTYNTQAIEDILRANSVDAAFLFPYWYTEYGGLPAPYYLRPVAAWTIEEPNMVCGWDTVFLFAPAPKDEQLRSAVIAFSPKLPSTVRVEYAPVGP